MNTNYKSRTPKAMKCTISCCVVQLASVAMAQDWKTDIPKEITTPDHVQSKLGDLDFNDGYPTQESVNKVRNELDWPSLVNIAVFVNY